MRLLVFSDIHKEWTALRRLMTTDADHYIAAGYLVSWTCGLDEVGAIFRHRARPLPALPGNHEHVAIIGRWPNRLD